MKNYIIEAGDTISAIAKANGISQKKLLAANQSISDANAIKVGDQLSIPEKIEDPATKDALSQSNTKTDSVMEECPNRDEWQSIKPLRFAVAEDDSEFSLPEDFSVKGLPALTKHKYIARELFEHTAYLYNPEEKYLLKVVYDHDKKPKGDCVFGTAPDKVMDALESGVLKQKKHSQVVMWLTHTPLTEARIKLLKNNPELINKAGQKISIVQAIRGKEANTFSLLNSNKTIAELQVTEDALGWTATPIMLSEKSQYETNLEQYDKSNSIGVCLNDPITITGDLCREFSIGYDIVMHEEATTQHPFQMAKLTRALVDREANKASEKVKQIQLKDALVTIGEFPSREFVKEAGILGLLYTEMPSYEARRKEHEKEIQDYLEWNNKKYGDQPEKNAQIRKAELEEHIHVDEMNNFLLSKQSLGKVKKKELEDLAEDWVSWLKDSNGSLDLALTWFDGEDDEQNQFREELVSSMVHNINSFDSGAELAKNWTIYIADQLERNSYEDPVKIVGVGAHFMIAMGYVGRGVSAGSAWLASFSSLMDGVKGAKEKYAKAVFATHILQETITPHMVVMGNKTLKAKSMWDETIRIISLRADVEFLKVDMPLNKVVSGINASNAALMAVNFRSEKIIGEAYTKVENRLIEAQKVSLYDLDKWGGYGSSPKAEKNAFHRIFAKYMNPRDIYRVTSDKFTVAYRNTEKFLTPPKQGAIFGVFAILQLYNAVKLYEAMDKVSSEKDLVQIKADFYASLFNIVSASITVVDKLASKYFSGKDLTTYMIRDGASYVGRNVEKVLNKVGSSLESNMGVENRREKILFRVQTKSYVFGRAVTKVISFAFRALPLIGAMFSTNSSYQKWKNVDDDQNEKAKFLSTLSMVANGAAVLSFAVAMGISGLALSAKAIAIASVLGGVGLALLLLAFSIDVLYGMFSDDEVMILLKRSFWGRGKYKYVPQLESFEDRKNHFGVLTQESHSSDGFDEQTKKLKEDMINGMLFEKIAFCDYLFKPMGAIVKYHSNEKDFVRNGDNSKDISLSRFIIEIHFPGFIHSKSDVIYSVIGNAKDTKVKLVTNSKNNTVQNDLNAIFTFYKEGGALLQFEINEAELTSHKVKKIFQHKGDTYIFETKKKYKGTDDGKGMDYQVYNLSLEYRYPSGFPVVLKYPKVVINDYKGTFAFWRDDQEFEDITMERATQ